MRLAGNYALFDCSQKIKLAHLSAALAIWKRSEQSVRFIFGDALGDQTADEMVRILRSQSPGGMTRTDLRDHFQRNKNAEEISRSLRMLQSHGLARVEKEQSSFSAGRPTETWFSL